MVKITDVCRSSRAERAGIKPGDTLVKINGNEINDVLDYRFYLTECHIEVLLIGEGGEYTVKIKKREYDDIGLDFETPLMDKKQSCKNKCIFCFIDQNPKGMRESIYFKDDDSRLSFLHGNYITLTNMSDSDVARIIKMIASSNKRNLLINAAAFYNYEAVKFLVAAGSPIDVENKDNKTALWYVCYSKSKDEDDVIAKRKIAKLLLDKGASVDVTSSDGIALYNNKTDSEIAEMIKAKYPDLEKGKGGCYVATAVYGSYDCPQVWTLRRYRDYTLAETWYGRAFIKTYYAISPTLVKWFGHTDWFKNMWKGKLDRMVSKLQANGVESTPYQDKNW